MRLHNIQDNSFFKKGFWRSKILALVLAALIILISLPLIKKFNQQRALNQEIKNLQAESERLSGKNQDLKDLIGYLQGDSFVEKEARLKMDLKQPGEQVAVVKDQNADAAVDQNNSVINSVFNIPGLDKQAEAPLTNPQKWKRYFFGPAE